MAESGIGRRRQAAIMSSNADYVERRQLILSAAADAFVERGYHKTRFDDIASRVGMDRASLYYYVGSKSDLFEAIAMVPAELNVIKIEEVAKSDLAPDAKLRHAMVALMASFAETYPRLFVYIREYGRQIDLGAKRNKRMVAIQRRFDAAFESILQEGIKEGIFAETLPSRALGYSIVGMVAWTNVWFKPSDGLRGDELGEGMATLILNGLTAPGAGRQAPTNNRTPAKSAPTARKTVKTAIR